ncbi:Uncharacterised protein [Amycolatopsis camponoti]|uniref:Uncharacterized protein n=1 Tax=Amycolatopsis camponoti TaxID=2606593 RepID=A0A6I8LVH7_9PSEU|nr:Uncharacterised protein [Amycolatopsis camponoti]
MDVSHSVGVQIGSNNLLQIFTDPRKRRWLIGISVVVTLTLTGVFVLLYRTVPHAELEVSAFSVQEPSKVDAKQHSVYEMNNKTQEEVLGHDPVDATAIDVTLKNDGTAPAVLLGADVKVIYAETLDDCNERGGEVTVAADYAVKLPSKMPERPFTIPRDIRFEVRGGTTDRFTLSIGPEEQTRSSTTPWVIVADVGLRGDDGKTTRAGTAALVTFPGEGLENLTVAPLWNRDCIRKNGETVAKALSLQADARADELSELGRRYNSMASATGRPAQSACTERTTGEIRKLCGVFANDRLTIDLELRRPPLPGSTVLGITVSGRNGKPQYTPGMAYKADYDQGSPGWDVDYTSKNGEVVLQVRPEDIEIHGTSIKISTLATADLFLAGQSRIDVQWRSEPTAEEPLSVSVARGD